MHDAQTLSHTDNHHCGAGFLLTLSPVQAAPISLLPTKWNMISSVFHDSDGSGYHTFVGGGRETLLQFDLFGHSRRSHYQLGRADDVYGPLTSELASQPARLRVPATSSWAWAPAERGPLITASPGRRSGLSRREQRRHLGLSLLQRDGLLPHRRPGRPPVEITPRRLPPSHSEDPDSLHGHPRPGRPPSLDVARARGMVAGCPKLARWPQANDGWLLTIMLRPPIIIRQAALLGSIQPRRFIM